MKKPKLVFAVALICLAVYMLFFVDRAPKKEYFMDSGYVFGTTYHITYEADSLLTNAIRASFQRFDASLSMFNPKSVIAAVNRNDSVTLDSLFLNVFHKATEVSAATNGAFDMTVAPLVNLWGFGFKEKAQVTAARVDSLLPLVGYQKMTIQNNRVVKQNPQMMIDASAIAKGYACDVVAQELARHGAKNYIVEIGGEVVVEGHNAKGKPWRVGINKPVEDSTSTVSEIEQVVELTRGGMATSGNYRNFYVENGKKYSHTIDPKSGYPVQHSLLSATILAHDCMTADAYATACMVMGLEQSLELCRLRNDIEGYFIYDDHGALKTVWSDGFPIRQDK